MLFSLAVGAPSPSCLRPNCGECQGGTENHCPNGSKSYGEYAYYCRAPSHFVLKIPDAISSEDAAPMLCGGITLYSPLKKNRCGPGKKVGIIGIGGLGLFGILYAKVRLLSAGMDSLMLIGSRLWAPTKLWPSAAPVPRKKTPKIWAPTTSSPQMTIPTGPPTIRALLNSSQHRLLLKYAARAIPVPLSH